MSAVPAVTLFTPTYNRAHTLPRLYRSIQAQTRHDFEWIIVDDGSTDNTRELVERWQREEQRFPIRYFWQPNQHKKVAWNRGVREAKAPLFHGIDSDDELLADAVDFFVSAWSRLAPEEYQRCYAVVGLCIDQHGRLVGDRFPTEPMWTTSTELYFDYNVRGEKRACHRTDVLREFPFPEHVPGLVSESIVWFAIAKRYRQICYNKPVVVYWHDVLSITREPDKLMALRKAAFPNAWLYAVALDECTFVRCVFAFRVVARVMMYYAYFRLWMLWAPSPPFVPKPRSWRGRFLAILGFPIGFLRFVLVCAYVGMRKIGARSISASCT